MQQPPAWFVQTVGQEVSIYSTKLAATPGLCRLAEGLLKAACGQTRAAQTCLTAVFASFIVSPVTAWSWYQHFLLT